MAFQFDHPIRAIQWEQPNVVGKPITELGVTLDGDSFEETPCSRARTLVFAGHGRTRSDGYWQINLRSILCSELGIGQGWRFRQPSVTSTPIIEREEPADCVVAVVLPNPPGPFDWFGIRTSGPHGEHRGDVPFSWHLVVEILPPNG
jgi:hypothetical protein